MGAMPAILWHIATLAGGPGRHRRSCRRDARSRPHQAPAPRARRLRAHCVDQFLRHAV